MPPRTDIKESYAEIIKIKQEGQGPSNDRTYTVTIYERGKQIPGPEREIDATRVANSEVLDLYNILRFEALRRRLIEL